MSVTHTWNVGNLDRETATGKVTTVHYTISATDGTYNSSAYGSVGLDGDITIPYGELTEDICIGWVQNALAAQLPAEDADGNPVTMDARRTDAINQVESALGAQISEQAAPTRATGKPW
jgi:hypothetical protein